MKNTPQYKQLQEALEALEELKIPENLKKTALEHLLGHRVEPAPSSFAAIPANGPDAHFLPAAPQASSLRAFIADLKPKGAVTEIPCLVYWAKMQENVDSVDEKGVVELYRRAGLKPPKNLNQSLRDLSSKKKYGRLESAGNGLFKLSRVGEDFVLHDVKAAA